MKIKFVFDTNVLISATLWDDSVAQKLLFKLIEADIQIFSCQECFDKSAFLSIQKSNEDTQGFFDHKKYLKNIKKF